MNSSEPLQTYAYPDTAPKGLLRKVALRGINGLLRLRGLKFPPYFRLRDRLVYLVKEIEPDVQHLCSQILRPGMTVMDVGANVGLITRQFCRQVGPGGRVYAFEPDPFTFQFLEFNTRSFKNKELTQCAISDNNEPALLHLNFISGTGNSLLNPDHSAESVPVACISLDEFLKQHANPLVDVIKIDVEGAELSVLRGLRQTVKRLPGVKIIIEYCPRNLQGSGVEPRAVFDELRSRQFNLQVIRPDGGLKAIDRFDELEGHLNASGYVNLLCTR
ncbi:MAG TPA: FkbM family methyltransferase [Candidatus Acidoferrales bacterium]|nr:FkbM family methyltransferase [Candidatus Acidoferrales bacterium]